MWSIRVKVVNYRFEKFCTQVGNSTCKKLLDIILYGEKAQAFLRFHPRKVPTKLNNLYFCNRLFKSHNWYK
jgi:hypothetical protein